MAKAPSSLGTSVRRYFVDQFFYSNSELFKDRDILDIGGKKKNKRGFFDVGKLSRNVRYVNIDRTTDPDIISDAASIPLPDGSCEVIILGETLEHVPEPIQVLKEAYRLLLPGGKVVATVPFMYPVHADPYDFGRYTDYYWQEVGKKVGFNEVRIEKQGTLFAIVALAVQHFFMAKNISWRPIQNPIISFLMRLDGKTSNPKLTAWTTGYGLIFIK